LNTTKSTYPNSRQTIDSKLKNKNVLGIVSKPKTKLNTTGFIHLDSRQTIDSKLEIEMLP
jgi:hypothetical protein